MYDLCFYTNFINCYIVRDAKPTMPTVCNYNMFVDFPSAAVIQIQLGLTFVAIDVNMEKCGKDFQFFCVLDDGF